MSDVHWCSMCVFVRIFLAQRVVSILVSSCLPLHCDGWRGARWSAPRQADSCWFSGLDMTRATSRSEELRLQGDQPYRGLHSAAGGIQGISPIEE